MARNRIYWIASHAAEASAVACVALLSMMVSTTTFADPLSYEMLLGLSDRSHDAAVSESAIGDNGTVSTIVPGDLRRRIVDYPSRETPGTVVVDTRNTYLYYVIAGGKAIRYGIGVGRQGFTWSGVKTVARKSEWPDWFPPPEMIQRQPYLPRLMAGGPHNPLGARAIYLSETLYRIHGTNAPTTIGKHVSSGCIRMLNEDVIDLYARVNVGTKVVVLPATAPQIQKIVSDARPSGSLGLTSIVSGFGIY